MTIIKWGLWSAFIKADWARREGGGIVGALGRMPGELAGKSC